MSTSLVYWPIADSQKPKPAVRVDARDNWLSSPDVLLAGELALVLETLANIDIELHCNCATSWTQDEFRALVRLPSLFNSPAVTRWLLSFARLRLDEHRIPRDLPILIHFSIGD